MFTTNDASWAGSRGTEIRQAIETRLESLDDARSIFGVVGFDPAGLIALSKRDLRDTSGAIADAFEAAVRSTSASIDRLPIDIVRPGVLRASVVATLARPGMSRVSIYVRAPRGDLVSKVDAFILERVAKKAAQLSPWGRGILVIVHDFDETAEDLRAGFSRMGRCPLWRIYWAGPSPELVELVASGQ